MVTTFEENLIAPFVLGQGRLLSALAVDPAKATHANTEVDEACVAATKRGWFADLNKAKVRVFAKTLPACVPSHILSEETNRMYINAHEMYNSEDEDDDVEAALSAAGSLAEEIGFAIKVPNVPNAPTVVRVLSGTSQDRRKIRSGTAACPNIAYFLVLDIE